RRLPPAPPLFPYTTLFRSKDKADPQRLRYDEGLYLKGHEEMLGFFKDRPDVLENTLAIADQVDIQFVKRYHVPAFPISPEERREDRKSTRLNSSHVKISYA